MFRGVIYVQQSHGSAFAVTQLLHNLPHPLLLQLSNLTLKRLDFAPAVQWFPIILPQTSDNLASRLLHARRHIAHLFSLL
jgi:hypothetical protein